MGRLQSHVLNASTAPPPCGNIGTGSKLARFALDHTGAIRCCLETIYRAHEIGALENATACQCDQCPRVWSKVAGWWSIGARKRAERFQSGQEASRERIAKAQKAGASKRSVMNQQTRERAR